MQKLTWFLASGLLVFLVANDAWPILLETGGKRVGGILISENNTHFTVRVPQGNGQDKVELFEKAKVKVVHQISWNRVEKLAKENPKAYRDLAEEYAEKASDPEAKELALRLYLIAAHLDPDQLGRSCLLSMSQLAASPEEDKKFRAMAYLLDPKHDSNLLKLAEKAPKSIGPAPKAGTLDTPMKNFLLAIRNFRNGKIDKAKEFATKEGVAPLFSKIPGMMDHAKFLTTCQECRCKACTSKGKIKCNKCNGMGKSRNAFNQLEACLDCGGTGAISCPDCNGTGIGQPLTSEQMKLFIRAEIWIIDQYVGGGNPIPEVPQKKEGSQSWTGISKSKAGPVPTLSLDTITSFDPRKCLYRNGNWVEP